MKKILKVISIIMIICVIFVMFIYVQKNRDRIAENMNFRILCVKSNSMYPTLKINDLVVIKKSNTYNENEIVTYKFTDNYLITHRIIKKQGNSYITKGDNNNVEDENKVEIQDIKGKVILIINTKIKLLIYTVFIFFLFFEFYKIIKGGINI